jgi:hypothetical protein
MTTRSVPENPFALVPQTPLEVAGRRAAELFGAPVEVRALPRRAARSGIPGQERPTFQASRADAILAAEAAWRAPGMALTGNLYPFSERQTLLWSTERRREPTLAMLEAAFEMEDRVGGTSVVNSIGAAGSVTRSHIHLLGDQPAFLGHLANSPLDPFAVGLTVDLLHGCALLRLDPPFPVIAIGLRGPAAARAAAMHELLETRTALAFNLVGVGHTAWLIPRSAVEVTAPFFPQALGGAELAGIWCCNDRATFDRLDAEAMQQAIRIGGIPWS